MHHNLYTNYRLYFVKFKFVYLILDNESDEQRSDDPARRRGGVSDAHQQSSVVGRQIQVVYVEPGVGRTTYGHDEHVQGNGQAGVFYVTEHDQPNRSAP